MGPERAASQRAVNPSSNEKTRSPLFGERSYAGMAELADAIDSGSIGRKAVQVQVLLPAPLRVFL